MRKQRFRIGELANRLDIERFIVRFWEKQFDIKTNRSHGKQRYYDERDLARFQKIKELLYKRGFTIAGARKELTDFSKQKQPDTQVTASVRDTTSDTHIGTLKKQLVAQKEQFESQIRDLRKQLHRLRDIL